MSNETWGELLAKTRDLVPRLDEYVRGLQVSDLPWTPKEGAGFSTFSEFREAMHTSIDDFGGLRKPALSKRMLELRRRMDEVESSQSRGLISDPDEP